MERRDVLRALSAAAALAVSPRIASAAWASVDAAPRAVFRALSASRAALVTTVADTILPRTDTPGAIDVGVPAWVDVIAADYYSDDERAAFLRGLDALDAVAAATGGAPFADIAAERRDAVMQAFERPADPPTDASRAWRRLKGLVVHGYFTSERVQKEVLKVVVMPGSFDGCAPMPAAPGAR